MRQVLSGCFAAAVVAAIALLARSALAPAAPATSGVDEYAQVIRVHLPWLLFSVLMSFMAASATRSRFGIGPVLLVALPVPVAAALAGTRVGVDDDATSLSLLLQIIEGLLGAGIGVVVAVVLARAARPGAAAPAGRIWEESGTITDPHGVLSAPRPPNPPSPPPRAAGMPTAPTPQQPSPYAPPPPPHPTPPQGFPYPPSTPPQPRQDYPPPPPPS